MSSLQLQSYCHIQQLDLAQKSISFGFNQIVFCTAAQWFEEWGSVAAIDLQSECDSHQTDAPSHSQTRAPDWADTQEETQTGID